MRIRVAAILLALCAALFGAAGLVRADAPPESDVPLVERWSADPLLWLALIEWRQRLRVELTSSRELCTAGTLTEIFWQIAGGKPPYKLQIEGSPANADAETIRINCGALSEAEAADEDATLAAKRIIAAVTDARGVRREAALDVTRARALPAPTGVWYQTNVGGVTVSWDEVDGAGSQSPTIVSGNDRRRVTGVMRTRANRDGAAWSYQTVTRLYADEWDIDPTSGVQVLSVAAVRHPLETETPGALNWSDDLEYASTTLAQNVTLTATHDTVTASWDRQPYAGGQQVLVTLHKRSQVDRGGDRRAGGYRILQLWEQEGVGGRHRVTFSHLPPDTDLRLEIEMHHHTGDAQEPDYFPDTTSHNVRTLPAPAGWVPVPAGPQNLRYTEASSSITVTWDDPYSNAESSWFLTIENPLTGARWATWVSGTSWSLPADLVVLPDTQYRVTVEHIDVVVGSASILFRTPPASATSHAGPLDTPDVSPRELRLRALRNRSSSSRNWSADPRLWLALIEWRQRLRLELSSSRELCTAGTLTEISWQISGGKPPYKLQIEGSPANADAETIRINCGALTEAEAADEDATLVAKRITATVTDARGAQHEAAIDVPRARPLPAPPAIPLIAYRNDIVSGWTVDTSKPNGATSHFLARWRPTGTTAWTYELLEHTHYLDHAMHVNIVGLRKGVEYRFEFASLRDRIESETPNALIWIDRTTTTLASPTGVSATATHDTVTVTWDEQPSVSFFYVLLDDLSGARPRVSDGEIYDPDDHSDGTPTIVFRNVPPDREYTVRVQLGESPEPLLASTTVRTLPAPPGWTAPPRGAQNVQTTTTSNSITVSWDAPYPDAANDDYRLMLFHPTRSGIRHERVYSGVTSYTFDNLEPGLTYRVVVDHVAIVERDIELEVTTKSRSPAPSVTPVLPRDR